MSYKQEQKLINTMVQCVLTVLDNGCREGFAKMDNEEKVAWVGRQLRRTGFHTVPAAGSAWLRLANKVECASLDESALILLSRLFHASFDGVFVTNQQHAGGPIYQLLLAGLVERIRTNQRGKWYLITDLGSKWLHAHAVLTED